MSKILDVIILAGGKGTRLSSSISDLPKPLAPVAGRPFLDYLVGFLASSKAGGRIIVSAGYKADKIHIWAAKQPEEPKIIVVDEKEPLGTGGALLHVFGEVQTTQTIVVMNGDSFVQLNLADMIAHHKRAGVGLTIATTYVTDTARYGEVQIVNDRIVAFGEKSSVHQPGWINAGVYLINKDVLATYPRGACSFECDIIPRLLSSGIGAYPTQGAFIDIGTPESYAEAARVLQLGAANAVV